MNDENKDLMKQNGEDEGSAAYRASNESDAPLTELGLDASEAAEISARAESATPIGDEADLPKAAEAAAPATAAEDESPLPFLFGRDQETEAPTKRSGGLGFAGIFAIVTGVTILMLFFTLWMGDSGFKITKTLHTDRTVFVREYESESGLLTPQEVADLGKRSTVTVVVKATNGTGISSGFVYSSAGYIITNHHAIEYTLEDETSTIQIVFSGGIAVDATVAGYNAEADLAVLKVAESDLLVPVEFGVSDELLVGDKVVAIGTPAKLDYAGTATFGSVSAPKRLVQMNDNTNTVTRKLTLIQTDVSVNPGNSGGPLFDLYGRVVGIVVMKVTQYNGTDFDGVGFAIPIDGARIIIDAIIKDGSFTGENPIAEGRSLLGLTGHGGTAGMWYSDQPDPNTGAMLPSETEKEGYHYMPIAGVYVTEVTSANAKGKVQVGDIITRVNGLYVQETTSLIAAVNRYHVGESVTLTVYRGGAEVDVTVVLGSG